jgi:hypothetical protein
MQVAHVAAGPEGGMGAPRIRRRHVAEGRVQDVAVEEQNVPGLVVPTEDVV